jgi:flagellar protein FlaJ
VKKPDLFRKAKAIFDCLTAKLRPSHEKPNTLTLSKTEENTGPTFHGLQTLAYRFFGEKIRHFSPLFEGLDLNLKRSGLKVNFKSYVSLILFCTAVASLALLVITPILLFFIFNIALLPAVLFGVGMSMFTLAFTIIGFYCYPIYRADLIKRQLENELPFTAGYMAILASAGVSPTSIFNSLSNLDARAAATIQAKDIVRDVNLFGSDIISALEETSKRTPSERFREMIEGYISTIHSGGDLAAYLRQKSMQYIKLKRISLKKYADTLSMLSEFYVAILLTGPLMLTIMLIVMAMLGSGSLWIFSPDLLLSLLTYLGIPLGAMTFLIILDTTSPKW